MVLTHPKRDPWHKWAIRTAVGDYGTGVIFVPLEEEEEEEDGEDGDDDEELPILWPLDPTTMTNFPLSVGHFIKRTTGWGNLDEEMILHVNVHNDVEGTTAQIIKGVRDVMETGE